MRGLSSKFMDSLKGGLLKPVLDLVLWDDTLCMEIRCNYINVYYRGGNIMRIEETKNRKYPFILTFNGRYCNRRTGKSKYWDIIKKSSSIEEYLDNIPFIKAEMDYYFHEHPKPEREIQQHISRENNKMTTARDTDYFIADIEYADSGNRSSFDMLAVKWISTSSDRRINNRLKPAFIEVKLGDGALTGTSGLSGHFRDLYSFLSGKDAMKNICIETENIFNQKSELGLIRGIKNPLRIRIDCDQKPEFILLMADHKPVKTVFEREAKVFMGTPDYKNLCSLVDIYIAQANYMGYGLYNKNMIPLDLLVKA